MRYRIVFGELSAWICVPIEVLGLLFAFLLLRLLLLLLLLLLPMRLMHASGFHFGFLYLPRLFPLPLVSL